MGSYEIPSISIGNVGIIRLCRDRGSNLGELLTLEEFGSLQSSEITPYISMYWAGMIIGLLAGVVTAFNLSDGTKKILTDVVHFITFGVVLSENSIGDSMCSISISLP